MRTMQLLPGAVLNGDRQPLDRLPAERPHADRRWRRHTILNNAVLEPLYELNRAYLHTLARAPRQWHVTAGHARLPDPVCLALSALPPEQRTIAARCPFSLFNARFHDDAWWRAVAHPTAVEERDARPEANLSELGTFALPALFFAWHLAQSNPSAARVVFGMAAATLAVFRTVTLTRLQQIALEHPEVIVPRWPERIAFWKALLDAAPRSPEDCASEAHLVGLQMLAAELPDPQERRAEKLRAASLRSSSP